MDFAAADDSNLYKWSNPANWTPGIPGPGGAAVINTSNPSDNIVDDIATLTTLNSLALGADADLFVNTGATLTVNALSLGADSTLEVQDANFTLQGPLTAASGAMLTAGLFEGMVTDDAPSDPGAVYTVENGGELILAAPVAATSELIYGGSNTGTPSGTIVLENPGATITAALDGINGGDVLELPGTKVVSLTTTGGVLKVVTDAGSFDFTKPSYDSPVVNYTAEEDTTTDPGTDLVAIGFIVPEIFSDFDSGGESNTYPWSGSYNWTPEGAPGPGGTVVISTSNPSNISVDDIATLTTLNSLALDADADLLVNTGASLTVNALSLGADSTLEAESANFTLQGPLTAASGAMLTAGLDAVVTDDAPSDPGAVYTVENGGELILAAPVAATSELIYGSSNTGGPGGTIVLENPGATITAALDGINGGDVLELPGTKVVSLTTTGGVLKVVTDAGSFDFTKPSYDSPIFGYSAEEDTTTDPGTDLVAITFPYIFNDVRFRWRQQHLSVEWLV